MYAVIKTGGKQYRVSPGDRIRVETLNADEGASVDIEQVLAIGEGASVTVGAPLISDASVSARVLAHGRGRKVEIIKFRRRKHHRKQMGHRQNYTELEITGISGAGVKVTAADVSASKASEKKAPEKKNGIGGVIEEQLNDMGVYHYSQIADFSQTDVDNINEALAFPGRIERDEWIEQARDLAGGGGGRTLSYSDGPNGEPDDLKKISGIGPVIETKLNELGIYHFSQIADFQDRDIELVNNAIDFPGRIERDE